MTTPSPVVTRLLRSWALAALVLGLAAGGAGAQPKPKVAGVYTVPVEQQWVSRLHLALTEAKNRGEIDYEFSESVSNADYERVLRQYAESGFQLIIGEAFSVEAAARSVARDYPNIAFLMASSGKPQAPNLSVFDNYIQDSSYLSGLFAGALTKNHKIGIVAGYAIPEVNRLINAFMLGARQTDPKVAFSLTFIGSWFDPPKAKEAAFAQIDAGADVLYAERFGVSDAAQERGVLAIGNVIDTQPQYPATVVVSALWFAEPLIDHAVQALRAGTLKAEDDGKYATMAYHGNDLSDLGTFKGKVPAGVLARVAAARADILAGRFTVPVIDTEPRTD
jgi:basic membrane lipoprotein Med (substrate-binding protein (PBP1-ABC) superfamily)